MKRAESSVWVERLEGYTFWTHTQKPDRDTYTNKDTHRYEVRVNRWWRSLVYIMNGAQPKQRPKQNNYIGCSILNQTGQLFTHIKLRLIISGLMMINDQLFRTWKQTERGGGRMWADEELWNICVCVFGSVGCVLCGRVSPHCLDWTLLDSEPFSAETKVHVSVNSSWCPLSLQANWSKHR